MSVRDTPFFRSFNARLTAAKTSGSVRLLIFVGVVTITALFFPKGNSHTYSYLEGSIWNEEDLIAQFSFPVYRNPDDVERERRTLLDSLPQSFNHIDRPDAALRDSITGMFRPLEGALETAGRAAGTDAPLVLADSLRAAAARLRFPLTLNQDQWVTLAQEFLAPITRALRREALTRSVMLLAQSLHEVERIGLLDILKADIRQKEVALRMGNIEELHLRDAFLDRNDVADHLTKWFAVNSSLTPPQQELHVALAMQLAAPNVTFNAENTEIARAAALDRIPRTKGIVKQNERIIGRHERLTAEVIEKLESWQRERTNRMGDVELVLQTAGKVGHIAAILFLLIIFLHQFRRSVFLDNRKLLVIAIVITIEAFLAWLSFTIPISAPLQFLILVPMASMLLTIVFDSRLAFYATVVVAMLAGALRGNDFSIMLASILGGSMALYTVRDIKYRTQIFRSLLFIFLGYAFAIVIDGMQRSLEPGVITTQLAYALANAIVSPIMTYGLLIFFEKVFGITTDLTLLELSDFNHPLLRRLSEQAPGTFHHSIVMGTLAETAAKAIGANSTLARVGAYYHDIGKMEAPEFFIENQMGSRNIHENLKPRQSAQIIINHVVHGIELGRRHRLPEHVLEFIPAHHGNSIVSFFYELERANAPDTQPADFQYPGPRPQTKETAIVMLADTIEAAARAIEEPTREKIERLIESIVQKRLNDGELDDCELTFKDIQNIKKSFLNILLGIHHNRIKYPTEEEAQAAAKVAERTARLLQMPSSAESLARRIKQINPFE